MLMGLTRQLGGALLLCGLLFSIGARAAETQPALSSEEQARYLSELKRLYMTSDERKALFAHANSLLSTYALSAGYQVGQADRRDLRYQLSLARPGELMLREETRVANGTGVAVHNRLLPVFGVDPSISYECPRGGISCTFNAPGSNAPLLTIVRDVKGAGELAKALSFLIRNVQKG